MSEELKELEHEHHHEHYHEDECHHEHHHDHGEDCDCGCHNHEHHHDHEHHHHEHGEDCDCGCHDHDHEHHHDHGHQYNVAGYKVLETHAHEGATVCSFEMDLNKCPDETKKKMQENITTLETWLKENDALIGHLKGYVKEAGPTTTFSTTGNGLDVENHEQGALSVGFASIVFGPTEEELKDKVVEIFDKLK